LGVQQQAPQKALHCTCCHFMWGLLPCAACSNWFVLQLQVEAAVGVAASDGVCGFLAQFWTVHSLSVLVESWCCCWYVACPTGGGRRQSALCGHRCTQVTLLCQPRDRPCDMCARLVGMCTCGQSSLQCCWRLAVCVQRSWVRVCTRVKAADVHVSAGRPWKSVAGKLDMPRVPGPPGGPCWPCSAGLQQTI
jgi:hypothetical protein